MPSVRHFSRIDTFELKAEIEKRIGSQKAEKYFNLVTRYLSLKLKKTDFDKHCISLIGRENTRLHNELIMAIVKNSTFFKIPSQKHEKNVGPMTLNGTHPRTDLQSLCGFPRSPKKGRTSNLRERKFKGRTVNFEISPGVYSRIPVTAPLGVTLGSKETRKVLFNGSDSVYHTETCHNSGQLPAANSLKSRLSDNLKTENLDISMDCVNILNNGLDCFLKRVIKQSLELARSRSSRKPGSSFSTSVIDFRVATTINPNILGEVSHILHENC